MVWRWAYRREFIGGGGGSDVASRLFDFFSFCGDGDGRQSGIRPEAIVGKVISCGSGGRGEDGVGWCGSDPWSDDVLRMSKISLEGSGSMHGSCDGSCDPFFRLGWSSECIFSDLRCPGCGRCLVGGVAVVAVYLCCRRSSDRSG